MAESDIDKKRAEARLAMSAGHKPVPFANQTPTQETPIVPTETVTVDDLAKKKDEARKAMEGVERRKKREEEEKILREAAERTKEIEEIKKKRIIIEKKMAEEKANLDPEKIATKEKDEYREKLDEATTEINRIKNDIERIEPFHSLDTDIQNTGDKNTISLASVAVSERTAQLQKEKIISLKNQKNILLSGATWFMATVFVASSLGILYYTLMLKNKEAAGVNLNQHQSLIYTEQAKEVSIDRKTPSQIKAGIIAAGRQVAERESLTDIYFTKTLVTETNTTIQTLGANDFLAVTNAAFSPDFTFWLTDSFMTGVYTKSLSEQSYVYIFKTRSFEHTLDILLKDGKNMTLALYDGLVSELYKNQIIAGTYKDEVVANIDTHTLRDGEGKILMIYAFFDRSTLIFAQNEEAFLKVLSALARPNTVTRQ
ncbi:MAG: hypothetical protein QG665_373 [Patescibacteria group bacterium]|nr:hypothetical protein [Patescibacteria group bacterium]